MKKLIFTISAIVTILTFASCENDKATSSAPVLGTPILTPNPCEPGDSVTITIPVEKEGDNYYFYKAKYEIQGVDTVNMDKDVIIYTNPLSFKFVAPNNTGRYTISFSGSVSFTAGSTLYGSTNSVSTKLQVKESAPTEN